MSTRCYRGGRQHKFQARYSEAPIAGLKIGPSEGMSAEDIEKLLYYQVYIHDICIWCGKVVAGPHEL